MNGKAFKILNTRYESEISRIMAAKTLKNPSRLQAVTFKLSLEGKPIYEKKNLKLRIQ